MRWCGLNDQTSLLPWRFLYTIPRDRSSISPFRTTQGPGGVRNLAFISTAVLAGLVWRKKSSMGAYRC